MRAALRAALAACSVVASLAACGGGERVAECDALLGIVEQVRACDRLLASQRSQVEQAVQLLREGLDRLEAVGPDRAPPALLDETKRTCAKQAAEIRQRLRESRTGLSPVSC